MILNPPLKCGCVEVTSIDEANHTIHCTAHVVGTIEDLATMKFGHFVHVNVGNAMVYLEKEGFIQNPLEKWLTQTAAILHNPNK